MTPGRPLPARAGPAGSAQSLRPPLRRAAPAWALTAAEQGADGHICRRGPAPTTKSARGLGGRSDGRSDAGAAPPPPGLAAAAAARARPGPAPGAPARPPPAGMSYKPNLAAHMPAASLNAAGSVHPPSTSMATSSQYRQLLSDYGPPSLGYTQDTVNPHVAASGGVMLAVPAGAPGPRGPWLQGSCARWNPATEPGRLLRLPGRPGRGGPAMPRRAVLCAEEKQARARERDRLKKRRRREDGLKRSLERQRNALAMRRRREERRAPREAGRRGREDAEPPDQERRARGAEQQRRQERREEQARALDRAVARPGGHGRRWEGRVGEGEQAQGTGNSQVPQSKYAELLAIIEELGKEIRPTYAGSKSAMERLKRGESWPHSPRGRLTAG
ncbi:Cyclin-dependent kinase 2-associated protein 1 [Galemys pyrenaicus]|uniref:Cyclin-dependent kinase 2-associated protein 1 n=1 Tax=Galemys pyrenaicus TaxID=202257 RepID=A0A8J6AA35_GALPY|nr:Cyclin-dependent kinase 2-associated protein 1 [Galemys pyrenaicus]